MATKQKSEAQKDSKAAKERPKPDLAGLEQEHEMEKAISAIDLGKGVPQPPLNPRQILALQRTVGNQTVQRMISNHQQKTGVERGPRPSIAPPSLSGTGAHSPVRRIAEGDSHERIPEAGLQAPPVDHNLTENLSDRRTGKIQTFVSSRVSNNFSRKAVHKINQTRHIDVKRPAPMIQRAFREREIALADGNYLVELDVDRTEFVLRVTNLSDRMNPPGAQFDLVRDITGLRGEVLSFQRNITITQVPMRDRQASVYTLHRDLGRGANAIHNQGVLESLGLVPADWLRLSSTTRTALEGRLGRWILWNVHDIVNACNAERRSIEEQRARAKELTGLLLDMAFVFILPGLGSRITRAFQGLQDSAIPNLSRFAVQHGERIAAEIGHVSKDAIQSSVEGSIRRQRGEDLINSIRAAFVSQHRAIEGRIPTMSDSELAVLAGQYQMDSQRSRESHYRRLLRVLLLAGSSGPRVRVAAGMSVVRLVRSGQMPRAIGIAQLNAMLRDPEAMVRTTGRAGLQQLTGRELNDRYVQICVFLGSSSERVRVQAVMSLARLARRGVADRSLARQQLEAMSADSDRSVRQIAARLAESL